LGFHRWPRGSQFDRAWLVDAKFEFESGTAHRDRRGFQVFPKMRTEPILEELVGHANREVDAGYFELRGWTEPNLASILANTIGQMGANRGNDLLIALDHFLCTPCAKRHRTIYTTPMSGGS
jgi:hypothetical protein